MSEVMEAPAVAAPEAPPAAPSAPAPAEGSTPAPQADSATAPQGEVKEPTTADQPEKHGKSRFERKISRLYREAAEAKAERDLFKRQLEELKPKSSDPGEPKLENFSDIEEFRKATAKYASDQAVKEHTAKQQAETQKQAQARLISEWEEKTAKAKYEDFDEVVGEITPTTPWATALMHAENGDEIAYHLGKNLKDARRIAALPPVLQILEIGKLGATLAATPQTPKTPSRAPAPITPLSGTGSANTTEPSEDDDMKTWLAKRNKQLGRR